MPIPRCTCSICGKEVNKSQTKHIGDGKRACISHEGVSEKAQKAVAALEVKRQADASSHRILSKVLSRDLDHLERTIQEAKEWNSHCWTCGKKGISIQEFYLRQLIQIERHQMQGTITDWSKDFFVPLRGEQRDIEKMRKELKLVEGEIVFSRVPLPEDAKRRGPILDACVARRRGMDRTVEMLGAVQVCLVCAGKYKVDENWDPSQMKDLTPEQLSDGLLMVELMRPAIQEEIKKQDKES